MLRWISTRTVKSLAMFKMPAGVTGPSCGSDATRTVKPTRLKWCAGRTLGGADSRAWAINDAGVVVGDTDDKQWGATCLSLGKRQHGG